MKKYFVIYLPVEGELEMRDWYFDKEGELRLYQDTLPKYHYIGARKAKLFLCSRDIKVGDRFFGRSEQICTKVEMGSGKDYYPKEMLVWFHDDGVDFWQPLKECYKVIGVISPEAGWAKAGDEFEEEEVRFIDYPGECMDTEYVPLSEFDSYYRKRGYQKPFPYYILSKIIGLKGPCGHFH